MVSVSTGLDASPASTKHLPSEWVGVEGGCHGCWRMKRMESADDEEWDPLDELGREVDAAFVVGTGALEEWLAAWQPVLEAIHDVVPDLRGQCAQPAHANFFMAELIAVNRMVQASERASKKTESL